MICTSLTSGKVSKLPKKEWDDIAFFEMNRVESKHPVLRFDLPSSAMLGMPESYGMAPFFLDDAGGSVSCINIRTSHPLFSLRVFRRKDWGWEFRSRGYVVRSVDRTSSCTEQLWKDHASSLIIEERKEGVPIARGKKEYNRREVPDIEEIKEFLRW